MTGTLVAVLIAIALIALAIVVLTTKPGKDGAVWPFYSKKPLSTPEQVLYHRLVKALPECIVLAQVQLSRFLGISKGRNFAQWNNRINRLSIDFLVCLQDSSVVAAIELDDSSPGELAIQAAIRERTASPGREPWIAQ